MISYSNNRQVRNKSDNKIRYFLCLQNEVLQVTKRETRKQNSKGEMLLKSTTKRRLYVVDLRIWKVYVNVYLRELVA